jgi:hypothetical protein
VILNADANLFAFVRDEGRTCHDVFSNGSLFGVTRPSWSVRCSDCEDVGVVVARV